MVSWAKAKGKQILDSIKGPGEYSSNLVTGLRVPQEPHTPTTPKSPNTDTVSPRITSTQPPGSISGERLPPTPPDSPESVTTSRLTPHIRRIPDTSDLITPVDIPSTRPESILRQSEDSLAPPSRAPAQAKSLPVKRLIKLLESLRDRTYDGKRRVITTKITPAQYRNILEIVEGDRSLKTYFNEELRYDYFHAKKKFVVRMETPFHANFRASVCNAINVWLTKIQEGDIEVNNTTLDIVKGLTDMGTRRVDRLSSNRKDVDNSNPDGVFGHEDCACMGLLIEVAWSNRPLTPDDYAKEYIIQSDGETRTFICVDMHSIYYKRKNATGLFSVYKANFTTDSDGEGEVIIENDEGQQVFLNAKREVVQSKGIQITLEDIVCEHILARAHGDFMNLGLTIKPDELGRFFNKAQKVQGIADAKRKKLQAKSKTTTKTRKSELQKLGEPVKDWLKRGRKEVQRGIDKGLMRSRRVENRHG